MTDWTRSDSLTCVHNGRISHQGATLLAGQVKLTHGLSSVSEAESMKSLPPKLNSAHMRFLSEALTGFSFKLSIFHNDFGFDLLTPPDSRVFPMTQRTKKNYTKNSKFCAVFSISFAGFSFM